MYTLRKITEHQTFNQSLGGSYSVVSREFNEKDFRHYYKSLFGKEEVRGLGVKLDKDESPIIKFIITSVVIPIYKDEAYYVMTESGKTFECINKG